MSLCTNVRDNANAKPQIWVREHIGEDHPINLSLNSISINMHNLEKKEFKQKTKSTNVTKLQDRIP